VESCANGGGRMKNEKRENDEEKRSAPRKENFVFLKNFRIKLNILNFFINFTMC